jgi:hypothetical protein
LEEVIQDSGKFVYGLEDAMKGLGIWEDFIGYKSVCVEKHQDG